MTTLLLVRHGQSTWNAEGRWQGQADPSLSDLGRKQSSAAATRLGAVDVIVSSPQLRASETAKIISEIVGVGPIVELDDLRERNAGPWSGLTAVEIEAEWPGWIAGDRRPEGFEATGTLQIRVDGALRALVTTFPGATMLVVCHGGVIKAIEQKLGATEGRVPNLAGRVLQSTAHGWELGDTIQLLDDDLTSGGDGRRV